MTKLIMKYDSILEIYFSYLSIKLAPIAKKYKLLPNDITTAGLLFNLFAILSLYRLEYPLFVAFYIMARIANLQDCQSPGLPISRNANLWRVPIHNCLRTILAVWNVFFAVMILVFGCDDSCFSLWWLWGCFGAVMNLVFRCDDSCFWLWWFLFSLWWISLGHKGTKLSSVIYTYIPICVWCVCVYTLHFLRTKKQASASIPSYIAKTTYQQSPARLPFGTRDK